MPAKNGRVRFEPHSETPASASLPRTKIDVFAQPLWEQLIPLGSTSLTWWLA